MNILAGKALKLSLETGTFIVNKMGGFKKTRFLHTGEAS
jgi:hypothetical protein